MEAIQVIVRGFGSVVRGEEIANALKEMGFEIREAFDGGSDSKGGLIETSIEPTEQLFTDEDIIQFRARFDDKPGDGSDLWQSVEVVRLKEVERG